MATQQLAHVAFHLTGQRAAPSGVEGSLEPIDGLGLRPALAAGYRDLTALRYDFPLVLADGKTGGESVQSLSALIDHAVREAGADDDGRIARHARRIERRIRAIVASGFRGSFSTLWSAAAKSLGDGDPQVQNSFSRVRAAIALDGAIADCDASLPARLFTQVWRAVQVQKANRRLDAARRLTHQLSEILRADFARSAEGRTAASLQASIGGPHEADFDFSALSRVLTPARPTASLSEARRARIRSALAELQADRFTLDAYLFTSAVAAMDAYRGRLAVVAAAAKAMAIGELEIAGAYRESMHDHVFAQFRPEDLDEDDLAPFPDYLVCLRADALTAAERAAVMDILSAALPIKILLQTDDVLDEPSAGDGHFGLGARGRQVTTMALGLGHTFVLQTTSASLFQLRARIADGLAFQGPALFSVFSGASESMAEIGPYLTAAAASESRAFPSFVFDPSAGDDWATRFSIESNPQPDAAWPVHRLSYEDASHQAVAEDVPFTLVDFVACDRRHARHFARLSSDAHANGHLARVGDVLAHAQPARPDRVPFVSMIDISDRLQTVLVDDKVVRAARRCHDQWRSLQELAGVHSSHAERALARDRAERESQGLKVPGSQGPTVPGSDGPKVHSAEPPGPSDSRTVGPSDPGTVGPSSEPYIETPRCSTCNECTNVNSKMFSYNENKQAYIKDVKAGTFAQLVQAAESCQLSIIHPGKPWNPDEPNLAELVARAEAFQ